MQTDSPYSSQSISDTECLERLRNKNNVHFYFCENGREGEGPFVDRYNEYIRDILSVELDKELEKRFSEYLAGEAKADIRQGILLDTDVNIKNMTIPRLFAYSEIISDVFDDFAVLSPVKNGPCGTHSLNEFLKGRIAMWLGKHGMANREEPSVLDFEGQPAWALERGDRVACIANDYDRGVFNGEFGRVTDTGRWNKGQRRMRVYFYDIDLFCSYSVGDDIDTYRGHITPAYAQTIHKAQGQEYGTVVLVLPVTDCSVFRDLIYTAVTRASDRLVVIAGREMFKESCARERGDSEVYQTLKSKLVRSAAVQR